MPRSEGNKPVVWPEQAKRDLERIFDHIAVHFTVDLATQSIGKVVSEIETLSRFPRKGSISEQFSEIRELIMEGNTAYYRNNESDLVVASIRPRRTASKS